MKVIVGAGGITQPGWISLEQTDLDIRDFNQWAKHFQPASLDMVVAEHVLEHLTPEEAQHAAANCYAFLKPGGIFRIAVPDGFHTNSDYVAWVMPGTGFNGDDHKTLFNYQNLSGLLCSLGFDCYGLEWFDETGLFHYCPIDSSQGYIHRSFRSFWGRVLSSFLGFPYTSLIVDAVRNGGFHGITDSRLILSDASAFIVRNDTTRLRRFRASRCAAIEGMECKPSLHNLQLPSAGNTQDKGEAGKLQWWTSKREASSGRKSKRAK